MENDPKLNLEQSTNSLSVPTFCSSLEQVVFSQPHHLNVKRLWEWLFHCCYLLFVELSALPVTFSWWALILFSPAHLHFFFFFFGWLKPCRGKKPVSVWVTSRRWELDVWSEVTGNGCLCSPISTQGIATWVLNSNVLTHYSLERRTSENTGVRSAELVVSFAVYSCRNKLWHSTPGVAKFCLPKRPPGVVCVLETSDVNSYLGGIYRWWHHSFPVFPLPH